MDFSYTPAETRFREELRAWLRDALPPGWGKTVFEPEDEDARAMGRLEWERKLHAGGWSGINWPKKYGGRGATLVEQGIYAEELARARAPEGLNIIGRNLVSATLIRHGTESQRERFLSKILSGEEVWCQGFSEPNAGSDLASIRCFAQLDGDHFVVNGQKVWTSFAQYANWCILLARTNLEAPKHKGISLLLVDMRTPGITLRPLNETFLDDVRVPRENLVGEINEGWKIAMTTLAAERGAEDALGRQIRFKQELDTLLLAATSLRTGESAAIDDSALRQKLAKAVVEIEIMRLNCLRSFSRWIRGIQLGPEESMMKLYWSHAAQDLFETALEVLGPKAALAAGDASAVAGGRFQLSFLHSKAFSIYSGSSEIQRTIIGERVLGLPK